MAANTLTQKDKKALKQDVESMLEKYRIYLLALPSDWQPQITASYSIVPPVQSNQFSSQTESIAIKRVDFERERIEYINRLWKAVNRLNKYERELIVRRYMDHEEEYDYTVYSEMLLSESKYYKLKDKAFMKLAVVFGLALPDDILKMGGNR
ncbi:ArpU family transcriptional regulator [Bacillus idriensis]|uniref:ArpU family transcriptional regulator n=1 Tax=Metabacillus idriensis TaxID=324768 RepID=A0A6I2MHW2_9BACI|nr:ArpU family phage packaging/lysis transcriptional regulator [Metabacillus idriensis]MRX56722.1 ArpU family transcriptional regulator [Metabacillus idriensis]